MSRRRGAILRPLAALGIVAVSATPLAAQTGGVLPTAAAYPDTYTGNCPAPIEFIGHVTATVPGTEISYRWEHSDGKQTKTLRARLGSPRAPGDTTRPGDIIVPLPPDKWRLALPGKVGQYSDLLHILTPFDIRSKPAVVQVVCND